MKKRCNVICAGNTSWTNYTYLTDFHLKNHWIFEQLTLLRGDKRNQDPFGAYQLLGKQIAKLFDWFSLNRCWKCCFMIFLKINFLQACPLLRPMSPLVLFLSDAVHNVGNKFYRIKEKNVFAYNFDVKGKKNWVSMQANCIMPMFSRFCTYILC